MARVPVMSLAEEKHLGVPEGGWKPHTLYHVNIAWSRFNPVYPAVFYTGFLMKDGTPGGYASLWSPYHDTRPDWQALWYMEVVGVLPINFDLIDHATNAKRKATNEHR